MRHSYSPSTEFGYKFETIVSHSPPQ